MSTRPLELQAIIIVGGLNDAPGWELVPDGHGGWTLKPVPGNNPLEVSAIAKLLTAVANVQHVEGSAEVISAVGRLANAAVNKALGKEAAGATLVVSA